MLSHPMIRVAGGLSILACLILAPTHRAEAGPYSALVVEVESERALYSQFPDELRHPASLTKMMTLYLLFEALERGQLSLSDSMEASAFAVSKPPSRLGLRAGDSLTVEEGILGLVTQSANDAATVIAETLGGSEANFADMMTQKARQLGMNDTVFRNAQGLPDNAQVTTAWDMFRLAKALLKHFPQYYHYFATDSFWFRGRSFHNHNHLLSNYPGADGIKTGFINSSGFNLVASARRNGVRLVGVVFGGPTHSRRDAHMREILDDGFAQLEGRDSSIRHVAFENAEPRGILRRPAEIEEDLTPPPRRHEPPPPLKLSARERTNEPKRETQATEKSQEREIRKSTWAVRVGVFDQEKEAEKRLAEASHSAAGALRHGKASVMSHISHGKKTYIAYFNGLSKEDAAQACEHLRRKKLECSASSSG